MKTNPKNARKATPAKTPAKAPAMVPLVLNAKPLTVEESRDLQSLTVEIMDLTLEVQETEKALQQATAQVAKLGDLLETLKKRKAQARQRAVPLYQRLGR